MMWIFEDPVIVLGLGTLIIVLCAFVYSMWVEEENE